MTPSITSEASLILSRVGIFESSSYLHLTHRRTGRCGVLAIATWAASFWATQGRLLTKKKEERKGRKGRFYIFATTGLRIQATPDLTTCPKHRRGLRDLLAIKSDKKPGPRRNLMSQGHFQEDCLGWQRTGLFPIAEENGNHSSSRSSWIRYLSFCKFNVDLLLEFLFSDIANLKIKIRSALLPPETYRISPWKKCKITPHVS